MKRKEGTRDSAKNNTSSLKSGLEIQTRVLIRGSQREKKSLGISIEKVFIYFSLPRSKLAMEAITQSVFDNNADLGIIFDTDVDSGRELNQNCLIALMSAIVLEEHPGTTIVTDSVTSDGLTTFIEKKLGGKHHRFKRGYKNVIDEAIRLNSVGEESHLAIETSGHGALKENHWLDDGAYLMVKLLNKLASARASGVGGGIKVLTDLVDNLEEPAVTVEFRLTIDQSHPNLKGGSFQDYGEAVLKHLENVTDTDPKLQKAPVNYEGLSFVTVN